MCSAQQEALPTTLGGVFCTIGGPAEGEVAQQGTCTTMKWIQPALRMQSPAQAWQQRQGVQAPRLQGRAFGNPADRTREGDKAQQIHPACETRRLEQWSQPLPPTRVTHLCLKVGVQLLAKRHQPVGHRGAHQTRAQADEGKDEALVNKVDEAGAHGEARLEHVATCTATHAGPSGTPQGTPHNWHTTPRVTPGVQGSPDCQRSPIHAWITRASRPHLVRPRPQGCAL